MAAAAESLAKLGQAMTDANITEADPVHGTDFLKFLRDQHISSPDDFVGYVSAATYEAEWKEFCCFPTSGQDRTPLLDRILWSRVKKAWETLHEIKTEKKGAQASLNEDKIDDPLPESTRTSPAQLWKRHDLELDTYMQPADALVARLYREMKRGTASLIDIRKVKALIHAAAPEITHHVALDDKTSFMVHEGRSATRDIHSVAAYYFGLCILGYAYAYAGPDQVPSMISKGTMVVNCPLNVNLNYADRALRLTGKLALRESASLQWLQARDVATRACMIGLMRQGWPQGEALTHAIKEQHLEWSSGPKQQTDEDYTAEMLNMPGAGEQRRGSKRPREAAVEAGICHDWNNRGCTDPCRNGRRHVCGKCGSPTHTSVQHKKPGQHGAGKGTSNGFDRSKPKGGKAKGKGKQGNY